MTKTNFVFCSIYLASECFTIRGRFCKKQYIFVQINFLQRSLSNQTKEKFKITFFKSFLCTNLRTDMINLLSFFLAVRYFLVRPGLRRANKTRCQSLLFVVEELTKFFKKK